MKSIRKEQEKRKPLKITTETNPTAIIGAIENSDCLLLDYVPPESVLKEVNLIG